MHTRRGVGTVGMETFCLRIIVYHPFPLCFFVCLYSSLFLSLPLISENLMPNDFFVSSRWRKLKLSSRENEEKERLLFDHLLHSISQSNLCNISNNIQTSDVSNSRIESLIFLGWVLVTCWFHLHWPANSEMHQFYSVLPLIALCIGVTSAGKNDIISIL